VHHLWQLPIEQLVGQGRKRNLFQNLQVVEEEADESNFWLGIIADTQNADQQTIEPLLKESNELTAIFTASGKTAKQNRYNKN
jgi:four helix bundle protein